MIDPGVGNEGVFAFGRDIIGHNDVGGTAEGDAGTGAAGVVDDVGTDTSFSFASCNSRRSFWLPDHIPSVSCYTIHFFHLSTSSCSTLIKASPNLGFESTLS